MQQLREFVGSGHARRRRHRHHYTGVFAPRARAPPELETDWAGTSAFAFDQSPSWDPTAAPPDPGYSFDQTIA